MHTEATKGDGRQRTRKAASPTDRVSSLDGETDSERIERRRRASAELGEPSPAELGAIEKFNRELQAAIDAVDWSESFGCFRTQQYSREPYRKVQLAPTFMQKVTKGYT